MTGPSAHAAQVKTLPCVPYVAGQQTMPIAGSGFTPGGLVILFTTTAADPTPRILTSARPDALGSFLTVAPGQGGPGVTEHAAPPGFTRSNGNVQAFTLVAADRTNPAAPIVATMPFRVVRFGMTRSPSPRRPDERVTYTARGFAPGKRVYAHFRFGAVTRRSVSLGIARGTCGITSRRMRALPTRLRYGRWETRVDQSRKYSSKTRPQWIDAFSITRIRR